jgi:hypothetical protein
LHEEKRQVSRTKERIMALQGARHVGRERVTHVRFEVQLQ